MRWGAVTSPSLFVDEFNRHNIDWFIVDITSSTAAEYDDDEVRMIATDTLITVASTSPINTAGTVKLEWYYKTLNMMGLHLIIKTTI